MTKRNRQAWRKRVFLGQVYRDRHGNWVKIELTQGQFAMVDYDDLERVVDFGIWCAAADDKGRYYAITSQRDVDGKWKQYKLHRVIMNCQDSSVYVDHIDGNGLNCRKHNLRICTRAQNSQNRRKQVTAKSTSKYLGVSFERRRQHWIARIQTDKKITYLGSYRTAEEAAVAYDKEALQRHGEFASTNFIWRKTNQGNFILGG